MLCQLGIGNQIHATLHGSRSLATPIDTLYRSMESMAMPPMYINTTGWSAELDQGRVTVATGPRPLGNELALGRLVSTSDLLTFASLSAQLLLTPWSASLRAAMRRAMPTLESFVVDPNILRIAIELDAALALLGTSFEEEAARARDASAADAAKQRRKNSLVSRVDISLEPIDLITPINLVALPPSLTLVLAAKGRAEPDARPAAVNQSATGSHLARSSGDASGDAGLLPQPSVASTTPTLAPSLWPRLRPPPRDLLLSPDADGGTDGSADGDGGWVGGGLGLHTGSQIKSFVGKLLEVAVAVARDLRADARARHGSGANFEVQIGVSSSRSPKASWVHAKMSGLGASNLRMLAPALSLTPRVVVVEEEEAPSKGQTDHSSEVEATRRQLVTTTPAAATASPSTTASSSSSNNPAPVNFDISLGDIFGIGTTIGGSFHLTVRQGAIDVGGALLLNSTGIELNATVAQGCLGNTDDAPTSRRRRLDHDNSSWVAPNGNSSVTSSASCFTPIELEVLATPTAGRPEWLFSWYEFPPALSSRHLSVPAPSPLLSLSERLSRLPMLCALPS